MNWLALLWATSEYLVILFFNENSILIFSTITSNAFQSWRTIAKDFSERFVGHCNTTTDIKEANYLGSDGSFIVAG